MQTFLPYPVFEESARCLDSKRLGKQRVEVLQILNALLNADAKGWKDHPATLMWRGYEASLIRYGVAICDEWTRRGYRDTVREKLLSQIDPRWDPSDPPWLGDERLHSSHRSNLLRKNAEHYGHFDWAESAGDEKYWPPSR